MPTLFREIEFENNSPKVCYSGQLLKGQVNIYFPVNTHVKAIYITFCGNGLCQWSESGKPITGSKTYLDERVDLLRNNSNDDIVLPAGNHSYPFEVHFRPRLPTSYEGTYGYIRYITTLRIDRSTMLRRMDPLTETFTVINPLNLDNSPSYREPIEVRKCTKFNHFCFLFCWKTDDLEICGRLPVRGYCPGQTMNLTLDVINKSSQDIPYFSVQFVQEVKYTANNGQQMIERVILGTRKTEGCYGYDGRQSIKVNTLVPSLPPTNFSADICGSRYIFVITGHTTLCNRSVTTFEIPVVIGTYPISNEFYSSNTNASDQTSFLLSAPPLGGLQHGSNRSLNASPDLPPYPDADPPTYEDAVRSVVVGESEKSFVPKYPTYRRETSYANEEP